MESFKISESEIKDIEAAQPSGISSYLKMQFDLFIKKATAIQYTSEDISETAKSSTNGDRL
jgi:endonuclease III